MQRNYPQMFSPVGDQDKDGFKLENVGRLKNIPVLVGTTNRKPEYGDA